MKLFLSHASADKAIVKRVGAALTPYVPDLWLDERELLPGDSLWGGIASAVTAADRVLVFVSRASSASRWVSRELNAFLAREDTSDVPLVIPVILEGTVPPPFLADRIYAEVSADRWASSIQAVLKGVLRRQSVLVAGPRGRKLHELDLVSRMLDPYRDESRAGNTLIVYDHSPFTEAVGALFDESAHIRYSADRAAVHRAWPRVFEFLSACTPHILQTTYEYFMGWGVGPDLSARLLCRVWRMVILLLVRRLADVLPPASMPQLLALAGPTLEDMAAIEALAPSRIPAYYHLDTLKQAWLADLDLPLDDCYELGFQGVIRRDGVRVYDVSHVFMPRHAVLESSLTRYHAPVTEIDPHIWIEHALPYIIARGTVDYAYSDATLKEALPHLGLRVSDYSRFGKE